MNIYIILASVWRWKGQDDTTHLGELITERNKTIYTCVTNIIGYIADNCHCFMSLEGCLNLRYILIEFWPILFESR